MTVQIYKSSDASAPSLTNVAGTLIGVLDACLVTGYGAKAAAGWTKAYSGTNLAAYKQGTGSNGFCLRVDDTGTTTARVVGYETMSDVNTGTNPFPTNVQVSGGLYWLKRDSATNNPWTIVATEKAFYFYVAYSGGANNGTLFYFGDIQSYVPSDAYHTLIIGSASSSSSNATQTFPTCSANMIATTGHYLARAYTQTGTSHPAGKVMNPSSIENYYLGAGIMQNLHPTDGKLHFGQMLIIDSSGGVVRGKLPGIYGCSRLANNIYGGNAYQAVDITGTDTLAGKTFVMVPSYTTFVLIETSNNW